MKHLQSFNEKNFLNKYDFKDEKIILKIIKSIQGTCPPKNVKNIFHPIISKKPKISIKRIKPDKFQTITFFTKIDEDIQYTEPKKPISLKRPKGILHHISSLKNNTKDKDDFYVANVSINLYHVEDLLAPHMYILVFVNNNKLICSEHSKSVLYTLLSDYIEKNNI